MIDNVFRNYQTIKKKPNSKYKVIGTGIIKKWENGYYHINVFEII